MTDGPTLPSWRVRRACFITLLVSAFALVALCLPASSFAASTYTWNINHDFTSNSPGANPDHDIYGGTPWEYMEGSSLTPSSFTRLTSFSTNVDSGLHGWESADGNTFVAKNSSNAPVSNVPAGDLAMQPDAGKVSVIRWTSPFNESMKVSFTWSANSVAPGFPSCLPTQGSSATVEDQDGNNPSGTATLPAHGSLYLTVQDTSIPSYTAACDTQTVTFQVTAQAVTPAPTLSSPANGSTVTDQPTFSGTAGTDFGDSPNVTVRVCAGSVASCKSGALQTLPATHTSNGSYAVAPSAALADGTYTAQTEQDDILGDAGFSSAVTFTIHNIAPKVTLNPPAKEPLTTSTPTFTGKAGTASGDSTTVYLIVYPGLGISQPRVRVLTGTRTSGGSFSIRIAPALPDGQYTARAAEQGPGGTIGVSVPPTPFRVKAHAPTVTIKQPARGSDVATARPVFTGTAGPRPDNFPVVTLKLYKGSSASGKPLGKVSAPVSGSQWSATWPHALALGLYTVRGSQRDDVGHTGVSAPRTFLIVPTPGIVGASVKLSRSNVATVPISCIAAPNEVCNGTVLVLTNRSFQPSPGGPSGHVRVMFVYLSISGGHTKSVSHSVPSNIAQLLRRHAPLSVRVSVDFNVPGGGGSIAASVNRKLTAK